MGMGMGMGMMGMGMMGMGMMGMGMMGGGGMPSARTLTAMLALTKLFQRRIHPGNSLPSDLDWHVSNAHR